MEKKTLNTVLQPFFTEATPTGIARPYRSKAQLRNVIKIWYN